MGKRKVDELCSINSDLISTSANIEQDAEHNWNVIFFGVKLDFYF